VTQGLEKETDTGDRGVSKKENGMAKKSHRAFQSGGVMQPGEWELGRKTKVPTTGKGVGVGLPRHSPTSLGKKTILRGREWERHKNRALFEVLQLFRGGRVGEYRGNCRRRKKGSCRSACQSLIRGSQNLWRLGVGGKTIASCIQGVCWVA